MSYVGGILVFIMIVAVLALIKYEIRYNLWKGVDKDGDALRNRRVERERREGRNDSVENLADRYRS